MRESLKDKLNFLIFLLSVLLIASFLKFMPSLSFLGILALLAVVPTLMLKYGDFLARTSVIAAIFILGLVLNAAIAIALLNVKSMEIGMLLLFMLPITLFLIPNIFACSLLIRIGAKGRILLAVYFWLLISAGLALLFLLPTGNPIPSGDSTGASLSGRQLRFVAYPILYSEIALIFSFFCMLFQRLRTFLVFLPIPIVLGYTLKYSFGFF